ncbi:hypothetical protein ACFQ7F_13930 [Streptomyces sp. NPDC056486]|uniref:hypothetical protein n=1 Tax=Streptomyces sp. NPDC056486 TaxID=3345835 RepID=UPI0036BF74DC
MGNTTPSDTPTAHDLAQALADQIRPGAAPRDVTVHFGVRRLAAAQYDHRSRGGPVTTYAQALHAALYGLPTRDEPPPAFSHRPTKDTPPGLRATHGRSATAPVASPASPAARHR